jgi:hypothetical protein
MSKKITLASMALAALTALAVMPAAASASPRLCETTADHVTCHNIAVGSKILATSVGGVPDMVDASGNTLLTCSTATMTGTLKKNNGTEIEADIDTATFAGTGTLQEGEAECTGTFGNNTVHTNIGNGTPWCLKATGAVDTWTLRGNSCTSPSRPITFVLASTTVGSCKYSRTAAVQGTYITDKAGTEDAILTASSSTLTEFAKEEGSFLCPSVYRMRWSLTLETDTLPGTTADPLYIK